MRTTMFFSIIVFFLKFSSSNVANATSAICEDWFKSVKISKNCLSECLNAHENNPKEPADERAMDLSNNRLDLIAFQKADKNKKWSDEEIIELFNSNLKENKFVILKPSKKSIGGSP